MGFNVKKQMIISIVCVAGLLGLLLRRVDLQQVYTALLGVRIGLMALALAVFLSVMWIKSLRWGIAIHHVTGCAVKRVFSACMIGFAGNLLLPARLGELFRVIVLNKHNQISRFIALTSVGIIQLFDLLALVGYFMLIGLWTTTIFTAYGWTVSLVGLMALIILGGLILVQLKLPRLRAWLLPLCMRLPEAVYRYISEYATLFMQGLGILGKGWVLIQVLLLTIVVWGLETAAVYIMLHAFHIEATPAMAAMATVASSLSFAFPLTPGNVGTFQVINVLILATFGVTRESALAYSIGAQGVTYPFIVGLGLVCCYREGMIFDLFPTAARKGVLEKPIPTMDANG